MYDLPVEGQIRTIACREGSSGVFEGGLRGLYQGYRFASTTPYDETVDIQLPNGTLSLIVHQTIVTPLPLRPKVHPFADGNDPWEDRDAYIAKRFAEIQAEGGMPTFEEDEPGFNPFKKVHYIAARVKADPERSTGIFAGAKGAMELDTPNYRMAGYLVIETDDGDLRLDFLEWGSDVTVLTADLTVNGDESTGMWKGATGELQFQLNIIPPFFGEGPYSGVIHLESAPPGT